MSLRTCAADDNQCHIANEAIYNSHSSRGVLTFEEEDVMSIYHSGQITKRITAYISGVPHSSGTADGWANGTFLDLGSARFGPRFYSNPGGLWDQVPGMDAYFQGKTVMGRRVTKNVGELSGGRYSSMLAAQNFDYSLITRLMAFELAHEKIREVRMRTIRSSLNLADRRVHTAVKNSVENSLGFVHDVLSHLSEGDIGSPSDVLRNISDALEDAYGALGETMPDAINDEIDAAAAHMVNIQNARSALHTVLGNSQVSVGTLATLTNDALNHMGNLAADAVRLQNLVDSLSQRPDITQPELGVLQAEAARATAVGQKYSALQHALTDGSISHDDLLSHINELQQAIDADQGGSAEVVQSLAQHAQTLLQQLNQDVDEKSQSLTEEKNQHNQTKNNARMSFIFVVFLLLVVVALCVVLGIQKDKPSRNVKA